MSRLSTIQSEDVRRSLGFSILPKRLLSCSHGVVKTFDDNPDYIFTTALFTQVVKAGEELELLQQPELVSRLL